MVPIVYKASMKWGYFYWTRSLMNHFSSWRSWHALTNRYSWILYWWVLLIYISMTWLVVECSIQSKFTSNLVSCYALSNVSNNGGKYGQSKFTITVGWNPRNNGMMSSKEFSPTSLVMVYGAYHSGKSFKWVLTRWSFCKFSQNFLPTWNLCDTRCWSWHHMYLTLALSNISWTWWMMCWMSSMKLLALSASDWMWSEYAWVAANGIATSMGHNDWNPNPTWEGLWPFELWRALS